MAELRTFEKGIAEKGIVGMGMAGRDTAGHSIVGRGAADPGTAERDTVVDQRSLHSLHRQQEPHRKKQGSWQMHRHTHLTRQDTHDYWYCQGLDRSLH